jgi:hypothetical protein
MSEKEGSRGIVDLQAGVLLGVKFFTSMELFVVGCGSVVVESQLTWNVRHPTIFYCFEGCLW